VAALKAVARRAWSNAEIRLRFAGSTRKNALPFDTVVRYQKRPFSTHVGRTLTPVTRGAVVVPRKRSARE
jgi:hypothetical protein